MLFKIYNTLCIACHTEHVTYSIKQIKYNVKHSIYIYIYIYITFYVCIYIHILYIYTMCKHVYTHTFGQMDMQISIVHL